VVDAVGDVVKSNWSGSSISVERKVLFRKLSEQPRETPFDLRNLVVAWPLFELAGAAKYQ